MSGKRAILCFAMAIQAIVLAGCSDQQRNESTKFDALVLKIEQDEIEFSPETHSKLANIAGLSGFIPTKQPTGLDDRSAAAFAAQRISRLEKLEAMQAINPDKLDVERKRNHAILLETFSNHEMMARHDIGVVELNRASPYVISPHHGAYVSLPAFFLDQHTIHVLADAQDFLSRLDHVANAIDDEVKRLEDAAFKGALPPKLVLAESLEIAKSLRTVPANESAFVTALEQGLARLGVTDEDLTISMTNQAISKVSGSIYPAYDRLIASLENQLTYASDEPGIDALSNGPQYYVDLLNFYGARNAAADLHAAGLADIEAVLAEMNVLLTNMELVEGSIIERLNALPLRSSGEENETPPENADLSEATLRNRLVNQVVRDVRDRSERLIPPLQSDPGIVVQLSESQPALLTYKPPLSLNESAILHVDSALLMETPDWRLPSQIYNKSIPGEHALISARHAVSGVSLLQRLGPFPALDGGWNCYAEDLIDEAGFYIDAPENRLGYLQSKLFTTALMIADTGIHAQDWSYERAVDFLSDTTGLPRTEMEDEVLRIASWPGLASTPYIGRRHIHRMRDVADRALGPDFDLVAFNGVILEGGGRSLSILEEDINAWVLARLQFRDNPPE